jgi:hypothetical protein
MMRGVASSFAIAILSIGCAAPPRGVPIETETAPKPTASEIRPGGTPISSKFDVDGDGTVGAPDAILIHRYILGFQGEPLIKDAVGTGCQRCTAEQIAAYLDSF